MKRVVANKKTLYCLPRYIIMGILILALNNTIAQIIEPHTQWRFQTKAAVRGGIVSDESNIYFGSSDGTVYAVTKKDATLQWKFQTQGAITSAPAIDKNMLYVTGRDNIVYAFNSKNGTLKWKYQLGQALPFLSGWDYHSANPVLHDNKLYVAAADGKLYALNPSVGKLLWSYQTKARLRATPYIHQNRVYQAGLDGIIHVLESNTGNLVWKYETEGVKLNARESGYDRTSIFSSPRIKDSLLFFGSRDGNAYCVNLITKKKQWSFFYDGTWAMSAPAIKDSIVYMGWSTNFRLNAMNTITGKERWSFKSGGVFYGDLILQNDVIITGASDGNLYAIKREDGTVKWSYATGSSIFSTALVEDDAIYIGNDDGAVLKIVNKKKPLLKVYHPTPRNNMFKDAYLVEEKITPYFQSKGFELLDSAALHQFLIARVKDNHPSVIVFPYQYIPEEIMGKDPSKGLVRQYLEKGGKIVWIGDVPKRYLVNEKGEFYGTDTSISQQLLNIHPDYSLESGNYHAVATQEGLNWGLPPNMNITYGLFQIPASNHITPLAINEHNQVAAWVRKFTDEPGKGFVSFRPWHWHVPFPETCLPLLYKVAMYGLE